MTASTRKLNSPPVAWVLTQHQWIAKREAGFHAIGRALLADGWDVLFLTNPVNWAYITGRIAEGGLGNTRRLVAGQRTVEGRGSLLNVTTLDYSPPKLRRLSRTQQAEVRLLEKARRLRPNPDLLVIESTRMVRQWPKLRQWFPDTPLLYRPSDPIICRTDQDYGPTLHQAELDLIRTSQSVLCVNAQGAAAYRDRLETEFHDRLDIVPNGLHLAAFQTEHPRPTGFPQTGKVVLGYVGASGPHWSAILAAADQQPDIAFLVICPVVPPSTVRRRLTELRNVHYVNGIAPDEVPAWIQAMDAVMVPYPDECRLWARGGHAKLYQAIAAGKPILGLNTGQGSQPFVSIYCESSEEFVRAVPKITQAAPVDKETIAHLDWSRFQQRFLEHVHRWCH